MELHNKISICTKVFNDITSSYTYNKIIELINCIKTTTNKLPTFVFAGVGKNWYICEKVEKTFISMGIKTIALDCTHALHGDMGVLMDADEPKIMFFISKSGTTEELIRLAKTVDYLRKNSIIKNITTISFYLNKSGSKFDNLYDFSLVPNWANYDNNEYLYEFDSKNLVPSLSINTMQMILDYTGVKIFEQNSYLVDNYKYNHLAGNNGKILGGDKILNGIN
ncbi:MAG: hypothetical protein ACI4SM_03155 [Candidatus Gastranaerophilaceae bacterium]